MNADALVRLVKAAKDILAYLPTNWGDHVSGGVYTAGIYPTADEIHELQDAAGEAERAFSAGHGPGIDEGAMAAELNTRPLAGNITLFKARGYTLECRPGVPDIVIWEGPTVAAIITGASSYERQEKANAWLAERIEGFKPSMVERA